MTRLHQIIAIEQGVAAEAESARAGIKNAFSDPTRLAGISRTYQPRAEDGDQLPAESTRVQIKVSEALGVLSQRLERLFDVTYAREEGNTRAKASIKIDGAELLHDVPVGYLMFLTRSLAELRNLLTSLPLLDPAQEWTWDRNTSVYRTEPYKTTRALKLPRNHVLYEATAEHPAQVQIITEDKIVGDWTTVKFSGALPREDVEDMVRRLDKLAEAVKFAREDANTTDATSDKPGAAILEYVLGSSQSTA